MIFSRFLVNPYFIFRVLSYILALVIGIDLFSENITFTDGDEDSTNEKKIDKGKQRATDADYNENDAEEIRQLMEAERIKQRNYANLSYAEKMLLAMQNMMIHDDTIEDLHKKATKEGTENLVSRDELVAGIVENRLVDTKEIIALSTKSLNQAATEDSANVSTEKRSYEEEQDSSENPKSKSMKKDSDINKDSRDNGEGPSGTNRN
jgi:hypothetical protein